MKKSSIFTHKSNSKVLPFPNRNETLESLHGRESVHESRLKDESKKSNDTQRKGEKHQTKGKKGHT
jgi:hypothetical protein